MIRPFLKLLVLVWAAFFASSVFAATYYCYENICGTEARAIGVSACGDQGRTLNWSNADGTIGCNGNNGGAGLNMSLSLYQCDGTFNSTTKVCSPASSSSSSSSCTANLNLGSRSFSAPRVTAFCVGGCFVTQGGVCVETDNATSCTDWRLTGSTCSMPDGTIYQSAASSASSASSSGGAASSSGSSSASASSSGSNSSGSASSGTASSGSNTSGSNTSGSGSSGDSGSGGSGGTGGSSGSAGSASSGSNTSGSGTSSGSGSSSGANSSTKGGTGSGTELPASTWTTFYEERYPNGLSGVWDAHKGAVSQTPVMTWINGMADAFPTGGSCPSFSFPRVSAAMGGFGGGTIGFDCNLVPYMKAIILITALFTARKLLFGG